jgi:hypothetical protein
MAIPRQARFLLWVGGEHVILTDLRPLVSEAEALGKRIDVDQYVDRVSAESHRGHPAKYREPQKITQRRMIVWAGHSVGHGDNKRQTLLPPFEGHLVGLQLAAFVRRQVTTLMALRLLPRQARPGRIVGFRQNSGPSREDAWRSAFRPLLPFKIGPTNGRKREKAVFGWERGRARNGHSLKAL